MVVPHRSRAASQPSTEGPARVLLVVAPALTDREGLFAELGHRSDFRLRFVASAGEAGRTLRGQEVVLIIASPEVSTGDVSQLLAAKGRERPALPLLVIRNRQAEEPLSWARGGVGVLRCPLLPAALSRSVDVVLGLVGARA
jgi:hypothetical protein